MSEGTQVTCENCGASVVAGSAAALRYVARDSLADERPEYLIVESRGAVDVLLHSCPIERET